MNLSTVYAAAHIDGTLDCQTMKVGILQAPLQPTPVAFFRVVAGLQRHPVWAIDRLAVVVYCYYQSALNYNQPAIEINLTGNLVSGTEAVCVIASKITWHTSREIRHWAEAKVSAMCEGSQWVNRWPFTEPMQMPVSRP